MSQARIIRSLIDGQPEKGDQSPARRDRLIAPAGTEQGVSQVESARKVVEPDRFAGLGAHAGAYRPVARGGTEVDVGLGDVGGGRPPAERPPAVEPLGGRQVDRTAPLVDLLAGEQFGPKPKSIQVGSL